MQIIYLIRELYAEYLKKSYNSIIKKITQLDLTGVAQWAGRHSTNQKVTGSIPWYGTCLDDRFSLTHQYFSPFFPPLLSFSVKTNK